MFNFKEAKGDLFDAEGFDYICITTNGFVKKNGEAVMGRGCAKQLSKEFPKSNASLGAAIRNNGNVVQPIFEMDDLTVLSFPVKPSAITYTGNNIVFHARKYYQVGDTVPGYYAKADPEIIERSARQLMSILNTNPGTTAAIPRPGCGAGELQWADISRLLNGILDERVTVYTF